MTTLYCMFKLKSPKLISIVAKKKSIKKKLERCIHVGQHFPFCKDVINVPHTHRHA